MKLRYSKAKINLYAFADIWAPADIKELAQGLDRKLLQKVNLFDVYEGKNLEKGKKSYGVSFVFQHPDKTLTDQQVDKTMKRIIAELNQKFGAELR